MKFEEVLRMDRGKKMIFGTLIACSAGVFHGRALNNIFSSRI